MREGLDLHVTVLALPLVEQTIRQTAEIDGKRVAVWIEQQPGSGGKESAETTIRNLAGWSVKADRPSGDKVVRAEPFAAQWQRGNVGEDRRNNFDRLTFSTIWKTLVSGRKARSSAFLKHGTEAFAQTQLNLRPIVVGIPPGLALWALVLARDCQEFRVVSGD